MNGNCWLGGFLVMAAVASKARLVAACLEAGVSVSRLALEHGVNANLLRKWIKTAKEAGTLRAPARS
ncbi:transposase, partial [Elstera sp.]|uniref:transposase n=1 Tax=Elstera sp. TaxID=1916664 RepID=UPI0037BE2195